MERKNAKKFVFPAQRSDFNDYRVDGYFNIGRPRSQLELFRNADADFFAIIAKSAAFLLTSRKF